MRGGKPDALESFNFMDRFKQLNESRFTLCGRDLALCKAGDDLAQQSDFLHSSRNQPTALGHDIVNSAAPLGSASIGNDAKRAILIAALHNAYERGHGRFGVAIE